MPNETIINSLEDSSALLADAPALRARLEETGVLFLKGIFEKEGLLSIREEILCTARKHAILKEDTPMLDGIYARGEIPTSLQFERSPLYREILQLPKFNRFGARPELLLLFHGLTCHKALHNVTKDRLRVSLEYRDQRKGDTIDSASLRMHNEEPR